MIINPIIPIWLMTIICLIMLVLKRKGIIPYIRQICIVILVFLINLRIMVPGGRVQGKTACSDTYVLFVVDNTISMIARDYNGETERLTAVKEDCEYIINELYGARFSVISFDNYANMLSPFTDNADHAISSINSIYPLGELYAQGSSMNICKNMMEESLKRVHDKNDGTVIVFFISDGEITNGDKLESFSDMKPYTDGGAVLGYGTEDGGKMYVKSYFGDEYEELEDTSDYPYKPAKSRIDEKNLEQIASDIGISYVNMNNSKNLDKVIDNVKKQSKLTQTDKALDGYTDVYYIFVIPLLLLLIYEIVLLKRSV